MARFDFNGIDQLSASFEQLANTSDEDKWKVLQAGADVLKSKHTEKLKEAFRVLTGALSVSIQIVRKSGESGPVALITPKGKHPNSTTGKRRGKRRSNGSYQGTNAEIAYILEYGSPRISASHWMETVNEEATDELIEAEQSAWDAYLDSINL